MPQTPGTEQEQEVKKAADEAQAHIATWKAAVGAIPASPVEDKVTLGDKAGQMESALLATRAMVTAARRVATAVGELKPLPAAIIVVPHGEAPDLKALNALRGFVALLTPALINAQRSLEAALSAKEFLGLGAAAAGPGIAGIGLALEAASKLLGYFRTEYTIGGTDSNADQLALAELVAGRLRAALPDTRVYLQTLYAGQQATLSTDFITKELQNLAKIHQDALDKLDRAAPLLAALPAQTAATAPDARLPAAAERLGKLVALHDAMTAKLMADGAMDTLLRQYALEARLAGANAHVLVTRLHKAGGSHYVTKNLWNLFGAMPFKVMGGVIASYSLFDAIGGELLQSDTYPVHGGFETANRIS